jgi:axial budding pattern protein 2
MTSLRLLFVLTLLIANAYCTPAISFPYNAQLPPVARIDHAFSHSFSPYTFKSDSTISYTLGNHPAWISLDSAERKLYGVPEESDVAPGEVVGQEVEIIATDATGSASMIATIVVSRGDAPTVKIPISEQFKRFGNFSAPSSLLSYPSTAFEYKFDQNTFQHEPDMINYYAVSGDSSPLPSWVKFDAASLAFSGQTPEIEALFQPPQRFDIRLVASDIVGFSASAVDFSIVVGSRKLTTDNPNLLLNATRGETFQYDGLSDGIRLDGEVVGPGDVKVTASDLPTWLVFDPASWKLEGTPEQRDSSANFSIHFEDSFSDTLDVHGQINIATGLFEATFQDIEVTPGEELTLDLAPHFKNPKDVSISIRSEPKQDWLKWDGLTVRGKAPKSATGEVMLFIEASSMSTKSTETEPLRMTFLAPDGRTTAVAGPTSRPESGDDDTDNEENDNDDDTENDSGGVANGTILLATIIPVLAIAVGIMLLVCFLRRRRNRRTYLSSKRAKISNPVVGSLRVNASLTSMEAAEREAAGMGVSTQMFQPVKGGLTQFTTHGSSRHSRSSETLGSTPSRAPGVNYAAQATPRAAENNETDDDNRSWFTVGQTPPRPQGDKSRESQHSNADVSLANRELLPSPLLLHDHGADQTFRSNLELTIPSLDDLSDLQLTSDIDERKPTHYSTITTSSAALPSSRPASPSEPYPPLPRPVYTGLDPVREREKSSSDRDWSTIKESESDESVPAILPRGRSRLSSQQWVSQRTAHSLYNDSSSFARARSIVTEASFASDENWRTFPNRERTEAGLSCASVPSLGLEKPPAEPQRPSTSGRGEEKPKVGEVSASASAAVSGGPSTTWTAPKRSASKYSRLNEDVDVAPPTPNWRREDSGMTSEGSHKAFL